MRLRHKAHLIVALTCLVLLFGHVHARQIQDWPYEKLFKRADLVIIVTPLAVRDAKEEDKATPPGNGDYLTGVVTSFEVLQTVKGEYNEKELEIVHFRLKEGVRIINGPMLVSFAPGRVNIEGKGWTMTVAQREYMLFLKKRENGRFEFVSGQFDPELSVKQMLTPLP
jgi:hypothetical protein